MSPLNKIFHLLVSFYIYYFTYSKYIYPKPDASGLGDNAEMMGNKDGKYELFAQLDETIRREISQLILQGMQ